MNIKFRLAKKNEIEQIFKLYQDAIGTPFCYWNQYYPTIEITKHDCETNNLYVLVNEDELVGAITIIPENEYDNEIKREYKNAKELARLIIKKEYRGYRFAEFLINKVTSILSERGYDAIHFAVVMENIPALKTYLRLNYKIKGETIFYGLKYYWMEKYIK